MNAFCLRKHEAALQLFSPPERERTSFGLPRRADTEPSLAAFYARYSPISCRSAKGRSPP